MLINIENLVTTFLSLSIAVYIVSFLLYLIRILKGPTIPDMVIAVDALGYDLAAFFVILSILFKTPILIGCAIVLALWIYAIDIYVSKYLEFKELGD
ncbi:MAG: monovalent cation/H+ antiporter complex subunit F [Desulfurococcaceae archaeon]|uniref:pH regulation protein F n=2 Tax=Staphylothermus marinus TaxID=2280 RepID=A0A7C4JLK7_STAMA